MRIAPRSSALRVQPELDVARVRLVGGGSVAVGSSSTTTSPGLVTLRSHPTPSITASAMRTPLRNLETARTADPTTLARQRGRFGISPLPAGGVPAGFGLANFSTQ